MKKLFILFIILTILFCNNVNSKSKIIYFNDVNTLNFTQKIVDKKLEHKIKIICSYDFCNFIKGESLTDIIFDFETNYLKTINDIDLKNEVKVKGIRITHVYLNR